MSKKTTTGPRKSLLAGASVLAAAAALAGTPAFAQDNSNTSASSGDDEAIVVTGTRLVRQDFQAISPVTTVGSEQLELTATMTTDTLLNELPQIIPGNNRTSNNAGGEPFATVDLRGLGPGRTLVLVNGERVPASSTDGVVDINTIPASLISRVEVVTGGASAVYGSDAMSGVINFVLKDDYEGAEINATYGSEMETGNAAEFETNMLVGGNFANGRGNMTIYGSYYSRNKVSQGEYDFSRTSGGICYDPNGSGGYTFSVCDSAAKASQHAGVLAGGSGTPAWGWITNNAANPFQGLSGVESGVGNNNFNAGVTDTNCDGVPGGAVDTGNLSFNDAGQLTPRNTAGLCAVPDRSAGSSRYNFAPDNYLIIPAERVALTANGHYDISDTVRLNILMNYTNSRDEVQLAPTPATGLTVTLTPAMQALISTDHPDLWAALQSRPNPLAPFTEDRRTNEVGTRNGYDENNAFYFIANLTGQLGDNWDWSLSGSYGQVLFNTRGVHSVNATALRQGLAGCQNPDGTPMGINALPGCVPIDIFGAGTMDQAMVDFVDVTTFNQSTIEENRVAGFVRGDLFHLPAGPVSAVVGFEYRDTYSESRVDAEQRTGNIYGFNAIQDVAGEVDVYELYTEFAIPLISEQPLAYYLGLEGGYRRSNYSTVGDVDVWKAGGEYAPTSWLRFRGIYNKATRAPNAFELFQNGDQGFPAFTDPCKDANGNGIADADENANPNDNVDNARCAGDISVYGSGAFTANNQQVQAFAFGNPNLAPETAETWTAGFVLQPDWFPIGDFRATVDYYDIRISNVIASFGAQFFINNCYGVGTGVSDPTACANVTRDPVTGQVFSVDTSVGNQGELATKGWDIQLEWSLPIGPGQFTANELLSLIDSYQINGSEYVGKTGIAATGAGIPDYKSVLSLTYNVGDWTFFGRWSYTPEMEDVIFLNGQKDPAASYIDASVRWNVTDNFTLTGVVNNLEDKQPPQTVTGTFLQANTDPETYRVLGRSFFISGRYRF
jgi:outer membrane receptor protein involved in Fe transport